MKVHWYDSQVCCELNGIPQTVHIAHLNCVHSRVVAAAARIQCGFSVDATALLGVTARELKFWS